MYLKYLLLFILVGFYSRVPAQDSWLIVQSYSQDGYTIENKISITENWIKIENNNIAITYEFKNTIIQIAIIPMRSYWMDSEAMFASQLIDYKNILLEKSAPYLSPEELEKLRLSVAEGKGEINNDSLLMDTVPKTQITWQKLEQKETICEYECTMYQTELGFSPQIRASFSSEIAKSYTKELIEMDKIINIMNNIMQQAFSYNPSFVERNKSKRFPMHIIEYEPNSDKIFKESKVEVIELNTIDPMEFMPKESYQKLSLVDLLNGAKSEFK